MPTRRDDPCPPTPPAVEEAAIDAVESYRTAQAAAQARDRAKDDDESYRELAVGYFDRLSDVGRDDARFQRTMQEFGRYLCREGVLPEHIVICARAATEHVRFREHALARQLSEHAIGWTIEGYYLEKAGLSD